MMRSTATPLPVVALSLLCMGGTALPALAMTEGIEDARLIKGWQDEDGARIAAIRIDLTPGWHTYWRLPGEVGVAPHFDWSASRNLAAIVYEWPRPGVYNEAGLQYLGFYDSLVLPVRLMPEDPSLPIDAAVSVFMGVCNEVCIPGSADLAESLGPGDAANGAIEIERALNQRALRPWEAGVATVNCSLSPGEAGLELTAEITFHAPPSVEQLAIIESMDPAWWIGHPRSRVEGNTLMAQAPVSSDAGNGIAIDRSDIRLTVVDPVRAIDIQGCATPS
ncbi:MAG: protein-disulfide reductase DsbD domain-containing protein [Pseudomonadota bacterium]